MTFTEFYAESATGSNLNGGDTPGSVEVAALAGTYNRGTGAGGNDRFTAASGTPFSAISAGRFVAVKSAGGAAPQDFNGRITAVNGGGSSIDISLTAIAGTRPADAASVDARVGGAWKGSNAGSGFPKNFITATLMDSASDMPRVNLKGQFDVTTGVTHSLAGPVRFQGYTSSPGDLGKFTLDGGTSAIVILTQSGADIELMDFIVSNNGTTGTNSGINWTGGRGLLERGVVHDIRGHAFTSNSGTPLIRSVEFYAWNKSNTANLAAVNADATLELDRCTIHDGPGSNVYGVRVGNNSIYINNCIFDTIGKYAIEGQGVSSVFITQSDIYNCSGGGINFSSTGLCFLNAENCNFLKNGTYAVNATGGTAMKRGRVVNCGFGTGTMANTTGDVVPNTSLIMYDEKNSVNYAANVTPWVDPDNGNFNIVLATAQGSGNGVFTETAASYAGTVGYPDIGAAQSQDATAGSVNPMNGLMVTG